MLDIDALIKKLQDSMHADNQKVAQAYKEVSSALGTGFDFTSKNTNDIYKYGYEMLSKQKLQDSMDAKTAFLTISNANGIVVNSNVKTSDSSAINEAYAELDTYLKLYK